MVKIDRTGATLRKGIPIQSCIGLLKGVPSEMGAFLLAYSLMDKDASLIRKQWQFDSTYANNSGLCRRWFLKGLISLVRQFESATRYKRECSSYGSSYGLLSRRQQVRVLPFPPMSLWCNGKHKGLLSLQSGFDSLLGRKMVYQGMGYPLSLSRQGNQFESDIDRKWGRMYQGWRQCLASTERRFRLSSPPLMQSRC